MSYIDCDNCDFRNFGKTRKCVKCDHPLFEEKKEPKPRVRRSKEKIVEEIKKKKEKPPKHVFKKNPYVHVPYKFS